MKGSDDRRTADGWSAGGSTPHRRVKNETAKRTGMRRPARPQRKEVAAPARWFEDCGLKPPFEKDAPLFAEATRGNGARRVGWLPPDWDRDQRLQEPALWVIRLIRHPVDEKGCPVWMRARPRQRIHPVSVSHREDRLPRPIIMRLARIRSSRKTYFQLHFSGPSLRPAVTAHLAHRRSLQQRN
jgi:hypothetical protein